MAEAHNYSAEIDQLAKDLAAVRDDVKKLANTINNDARSEAGRWSDDLSKKAHDMAEDAKTAGREGIDAVSRQIEANPLTSVFVAAGIGFIIGALLRR